MTSTSIGDEDVYVYLICTKDNQCKIGSSDNPYRRLRVIQGCCPLPLEIRYVIKHHRAGELEGFLHSHFWEQEGKHIHGEWFQLTEQDLDKIISKWPCVKKVELALLQQEADLKRPSKRGSKKREANEPRSSKPPITQFTKAVVERHNQRILKGYAGLLQK